MIGGRWLVVGDELEEGRRGKGKGRREEGGGRGKRKKGDGRWLGFDCC